MRLRLLRHQLGDGFDARTLFAILHPQGDAFWLDSGPGGRAFLGTGDRVVLPPGEVLPALRSELAAVRVDEPLGGVPLGLVGFLGYELRGETTGAEVRERGRHPDAAFLRVDRLVLVEGDGSASLLALGTGWEGELGEWRDRTAAQLNAQLVEERHAAGVTRLETSAAQAPTSRSSATSGGAPTWHDTPERYLANIDACRDA